MKRIAILMIIMLLAPTALATGPQSPFYGVDRAMDHVKIFFSQEKAEASLKAAQERLEELEVEDSPKAKRAYERFMDKALKHLESMDAQARNETIERLMKIQI